MHRPKRIPLLAPRAGRHQSAYPRQDVLRQRCAVFRPLQSRIGRGVFQPARQHASKAAHSVEVCAKRLRRRGETRGATGTAFKTLPPAASNAAGTCPPLAGRCQDTAGVHYIYLLNPRLSTWREQPLDYPASNSGLLALFSFKARSTHPGVACSPAVVASPFPRPAGWLWCASFAEHARPSSVGEGRIRRGMNCAKSRRRRRPKVPSCPRIRPYSLQQLGSAFGRFRTAQPSTLLFATRAIHLVPSGQDRLHPPLWASYCARRCWPRMAEAFELGDKRDRLGSIILIKSSPFKPSASDNARSRGQLSLKWPATLSQRMRFQNGFPGPNFPK